MTLHRRLLIYGALLPSLVLALALCLIGLVLHHLLIDSVDQGLLLQAASESVSLFDRPGGDAHLHFGDSSLSESLRRLGHEGALYGADGARLKAFPADGLAPPRLDVGALEADRPTLVTESIAGGGRARVLTMTIKSPRGEPHALWIAVSLAASDAALTAYARAAALIGGAATLLLLLLQIAHARGLVGRVQRLAQHMERLRDGDFSRAPAEDRGDDVIAGLRDAIADATDKLRRAAEGQHRLIADAAHELRTPLAAMRMEIDVTLRRERSPAQLAEALERIRTEVDRLADLATRLLDLARLRGAEWERVPVDLVALCEAALAGVRPVAERRGVALHLEAPRAVMVRGNPGPLRQAVDNLLDNAIKHSPADAAVELRLRDDPSEVAIVIDDRGPGVPSGHEESIFAPFHRLDRAGAGAGLGLAIVRDVAGAHGGRASVRAREGGGSSFTLTIARG
ncbi:MAG: HAMP domain-containing sensor histidine kinase [Nannocystaceae bacterium]